MELSPEKHQVLEEAAYQIRRLSIEMIAYGMWGHIGGSLSMAELLAVLYFDQLRIRPDDPRWPGRDRLILSKAHGSPALYAALALRGFFPVERLYTYCEPGGLEGHTDMTRTPGLESSGGPLGMGLSVAVGVALGYRYREDPSARAYCILGDGECNEGNVWEAAMAAAHYRLDNLIAIVDYNKVMAKGFTWDLMGVEPFAEKWRAFGWDVLETDGHAIVDVHRTLYRARWVQPRGLLTGAELDLPAGGGGGLVIVGSHVPRSTAQLQRLLGLPGIASIEVCVPGLLDPERRMGEVRRTTEAARAGLRRGQTVVIYTSRTLITGPEAAGSIAVGQRISAGLVEIVRRIETQPRYGVAKGGITASDIATAGLGVKRALVIGQILPGVPVWRLGAESRYPGLNYVVFPGNVGDEGALVALVQMLDGTDGRPSG